MAPTNPDRTRARALADDAAASGDALGWFEQLYAEAETGDAVVPWADLEPNPFLVAALAERALPPGHALVVGCGYGDEETRRVVRLLALPVRLAVRCWVLARAEWRSRS